MKKRINDPALITPAYEDQGLFKRPSAELVVTLFPKFGTNSRKDTIIKGLMQNDVEVDVIFAGRRKQEAAELVTLLRRLWDAANFQVPKGHPAPVREDVRVPTRIQGSWRMRVEEGEEEAEALYTKEYQLLVARWAFNSDNGAFRSFGTPPFQEQVMNRSDA